MKKKTGLLIAVLLISATVIPFFAFNVHGETYAGPDQTVYINDIVAFNASTTSNVSNIVNVNWNFGDGTTPANGSNPNLLTATTHVYNQTGIYTVTLSVKFNSQLNTTETDSLNVTVIVNVPPVADAGIDQTVEQTSPAGAEVTLDGSNSTDPYGDILTYNWTWTGGSASGVNPIVMLPAGVTNVTLMVSDGVFNDTDTVTITIADTMPPYVDAGNNMTFEATSPSGAEVTLHGNATDDVDMELEFVWSEGTTILGNAANLTTTLSIGSHTLTLSATDDSGNTGTDTVIVTVVDTTPPEISVSIDPDMMWPPNHKYVNVKTVVTVYDLGDSSPTLSLVSVTSNEPDNGKGDGNTVNDIVIMDDYTFEFRAERSGNGVGRVYTITYQATDASGNTAQASATVTVKHNP